MTAAAILAAPMRAPIRRSPLPAPLATAWLVSAAVRVSTAVLIWTAVLISSAWLTPAEASAQARAPRVVRPLRPRTTSPAAAPAQPATTPEPPAALPVGAVPLATGEAPSPDETDPAPEASDPDAGGLAIPPPDGATTDNAPSDSGASDAPAPGATGRRSDRPRRPRRDATLHDGIHPADADDEDAHERWRIPSDLVNPFRDRRGFATRRRAREADAESWFITDEDLLDPWEAGAIGPFYSVQCEGSRCRPDSDRPIYLARPRAPGLAHLARPRRRPTRPSVDLAALASVTTVDDSARARLEAQATVHSGAFGVGLSLATSTGRTRVDGERLTHTRHAFAAIAQHRLHDGIVALDLGVGAGLMVMGLDETRVAPLARVMATLGVPLVGNASLVFRADALTTFVRPAERATTEGPSAFEFGMGVGLRIATR
jgi:hypothetical protein